MTSCSHGFNLDDAIATLHEEEVEDQPFFDGRPLAGRVDIHPGGRPPSAPIAWAGTDDVQAIPTSPVRKLVDREHVLLMKQWDLLQKSLSDYHRHASDIVESLGKAPLMEAETASLRIENKRLRESLARIEAGIKQHEGENDAVSRVIDNGCHGRNNMNVEIVEDVGIQEDQEAPQAVAGSRTTAGEFASASPLAPTQEKKADRPPSRLVTPRRPSTRRCYKTADEQQDGQAPPCTTLITAWGKGRESPSDSSEISEIKVKQVWGATAKPPVQNGEGCETRSTKVLAPGPGSLQQQAVRMSSVLPCPRDDDFEEPAAQREQNNAPLRAGVFADADHLKAEMRKIIAEKGYDVRDLYYENGWAQWVARSQMFDHTTFAVVLMNALWMWIDTDWNKDDSSVPSWVFLLADNFFCMYFIGELIVRYCAFEDKSRAIRDPWFAFDSGLAIMMAVDVWVVGVIISVVMDNQQKADDTEDVKSVGALRILRIFRLLRLARVARLLRAAPELFILVKGMAVATKSIFFTLCLLTVIIYTFGIAFTQLMDGTDVGKTMFPTVPEAMNTLLLRGALPDQESIVTDVSEVHPLFRYLILFYILMASLIVMNMLVGVFCEVVTVVSEVEKEQLLLTWVKTELQTFYTGSEMDQNGDSILQRDEFDLLLSNPTVAKALSTVGVDVLGLVDLTDFIFAEKDGLSFVDFMEVILQFRGSNTATVKDVVFLRRLLTQEIQNVIDTYQAFPTQVAQALQPIVKVVGRLSQQVESRGCALEDLTPSTK
eukprot:TRINITY_DN11018_c0_g1_i1.p1 TRINITY_DN11018_c0_g1~~TRINITY_DN11018_c0_g1_i1.p1  ORF type:complete len:827 (+),score=157.68 TRINITY_DN11018_c0_g1_i1:169-2481(+)